MKIFLSIFLLTAVLFSIVACNNSAEDVTSKSTELETNINNTTHTSSDKSSYREIELDLNNYKTYLTYTATSGLDNDGRRYSNFIHTVKGALSFAYYENVVLTFDITYSASINNEQKTYHGKYNLVLNAAGDGEFHANDNELLDSINVPDYIAQRFYTVDDYTISLESISGKVCFSIQ